MATATTTQEIEMTTTPKAPRSLYGTPEYDHVETSIMNLVHRDVASAICRLAAITSETNPGVAEGPAIREYDTLVAAYGGLAVGRYTNGIHGWHMLLRRADTLRVLAEEVTA